MAGVQGRRGLELFVDASHTDKRVRCETGSIPETGEMTCGARFRGCRICHPHTRHAPFFYCDQIAIAHRVFRKGSAGSPCQFGCPSSRRVQAAQGRGKTIWLWFEGESTGRLIVAASDSYHTVVPR